MASDMTPNEQAVEAVARALCNEQFGMDSLVSPWWGDQASQPANSIRLSGAQKDQYRTLARAAIAAIPTPPPADHTDLIEHLWPHLRAYVTPPPFHHNEDGWRTVVRMLLAKKAQHERAALQAHASPRELEHARYQWAANELLACDYGDNNRGEVGWRVYGWRSRDGERSIYGPSIDAAIDAEIARAAQGEAS